MEDQSHLTLGEERMSIALWWKKEEEEQTKKKRKEIKKEKKRKEKRKRKRKRRKTVGRQGPITRNGVRTHVCIRTLDLKSNALTTRPPWYMTSLLSLNIDFTPSTTANML